MTHRAAAGVPDEDDGPAGADVLPDEGEEFAATPHEAGIPGQRPVGHAR
ncbi:hypothetical protein [Kineococcus glutinatus]|uniref:Uncharacterized protein n=1 Tax=Kineococcus glutinatus TaxID=1070872 RepID=A0ABP9HLQ6_9ACTN